MMFTFTPSTNKNFFLHSKIPDFVPRQTHHLCVLNDCDDAIQHILKLQHKPYFFLHKTKRVKNAISVLYFFTSTKE